MIGSAGQGDSTPKITLSEFTTSKELMEKELDARIKREWSFRTYILKKRLGSQLAKYALLHLDQDTYTCRPSFFKARYSWTSS